MTTAAKIALVCLWALGGAGTAQAEGRVTLGWGRLLTNDFIGDGNDRWRTSSYMLNWMRGPEGLAALPAAPGVLIEHRFRAEIIAPRNLNGAGSDDRAYVGALSYGVHSQYAVGKVEISLGVDLVALGPQTGLSGIQDWFHGQIGQPLLGSNVIDAQVANAIWPTAVVEVGYPVALGRTAELRPFAEVQVGVEDLLRIGADFRFGAAGTGALSSRDPTTGQLVQTVKNPGFGWSVVGGADYAVVGNSAYFPADFGTLAAEIRSRARLGLHWQADEKITFFYGVTWLSPEYQGQIDGQILGSVKLNFNF